MPKLLTAEECQSRLTAFRALMDRVHPDWDSALIIGRVNQYYFMGTMQDGLLLIRKSGETRYFVRKSLARALDESPLEELCFPMESYRDAAVAAGKELGVAYLEGELVPVSMLERMKKHFSMSAVKTLDRTMGRLRSVKSPYELSVMRRAGAIHHELLTKVVPTLLREGMSETDFAAALFDAMLKRGYQGMIRFSMFQCEMVLGQLGFGENSLRPTSFDGPGGHQAMSAAAPVLADPRRRLKRGDLVFVDVANGIDGYHSDKTQVYQFGGTLSDEVKEAHAFCLDIERRLSERLSAGEIPSRLYADMTDRLTARERENFMGYGERGVRFLGHGVGLHVDELPVIARGFDDPLEENMVMALEPKKGIAGVGMVGVEDTYLVTKRGGECITGGGGDILLL